VVALGRRVEHDPRSRRYTAPRGTVRTVLWTHAAPVLDQQDIGACTGFSLAQLLNCTKFHRSRPKRRYLDARAAYDLYSVATELDQWEGTWPPSDSGSSGLAVAKAGVRLGYLSSYTHAFGLYQAVEALSISPVITGTNWYDGMYDTDSKGFVSLSGDVVGGHEWLLIGANTRDGYLTGLNSWGPQWGLRGRFRIRIRDYDRLLHEQGDVTVPIGKP
jgi:hypothetical protein